MLFNTAFKFFLVTFSISSFLIIPTVQGTTLGYSISFILIFILFFSSSLKIKFTNKLFITILFFIFYNMISQMSLFISDSEIYYLSLVDSWTSSSKVLLRRTLFTQFIYLLPCFITIYLIIYYYNDSLYSYIKYGISFLCLYGIYEFIFYILFGYGGDFISNREFSKGDSITSGSFFQIINIFGYSIQRIKSLTGEPSMFALTVLPFWIVAIKQKSVMYSSLLAVTLLLSFSTSAYIGILLFVMQELIINKKAFIKKIFYFAIFFIFFMIILLLFKPIIDMIIFNKFALQNISGIVRYSSFFNHISFWYESSLIIKLFGIGFGYVRSNDFLSTLLVNQGLIGLIIFISLFIYPVYHQIKHKHFENIYASPLIIILIIILLSVPEFAYLSTWIILGLAYRNIYLYNRNKNYKS